MANLSDAGLCVRSEGLILRSLGCFFPLPVHPSMLAAHFEVAQLPACSNAAEAVEVLSAGFMLQRATDDPSGQTASESLPQGPHTRAHDRA